MWNTPHYGDYDSYLLLEEMKKDPINKDMIKAIDNQIKRVEKRYSSDDVMIGYAKNLPAIVNYYPKTWADIKTVEVNNIFEHMNRHLDIENIKAAYFMSGVTSERLKQSGKTWGDVYESLIQAMNNDTWCLYGRKMALITYYQLANKKFPGVFDFKSATKDWQDRKQKILEEKNKSTESGS